MPITSNPVENSSKQILHSFITLKFSTFTFFNAAIDDLVAGTGLKTCPDSQIALSIWSWSS